MMKIKTEGIEYTFYDTRYGIECCTLEADGSVKECRICMEAAYPDTEEKAMAMLNDCQWFSSDELLDRKLFVGGLCRLEPGKDEMVRVYKEDQFGRYSYNELIRMGFMSDLDIEGLKDKRATEKMDEVADFCANNDISYVKIFKEERDATEFAEFLHDEGFVE